MSCRMDTSFWVFLFIILTILINLPDTEVRKVIHSIYSIQPTDSNNLTKPNKTAAHIWCINILHVSIQTVKFTFVINFHLMMFHVISNAGQISQKVLHSHHHPHRHYRRPRPHRVFGVKLIPSISKCTYHDNSKTPIFRGERSSFYVVMSMRGFCCTKDES